MMIPTYIFRDDDPPILNQLDSFWRPAGSNLEQIGSKLKENWSSFEPAVSNFTPFEFNLKTALSTVLLLREWPCIIFYSRNHIQNTPTSVIYVDNHRLNGLPAIFGFSKWLNWPLISCDEAGWLTNPCERYKETISSEWYPTPQSKEVHAVWYSKTSNDGLSGYRNSLYYGLIIHPWFSLMSMFFT